MSTPFVVLLGAGASVPAGIPTIDKMTAGFSQQLNGSGKRELIDAFSFIERVLREKEGRFDVELALQALTELTEGTTSTIQYFYGKSLDEADKFRPQFSKVKTRLKEYIREACEDPGDFSYLKPLPLGFMGEKGLDIFTLNYDPTIEALCYEENIPIIDGFDPEWNPSSFDDERFAVRLYKVHGSVYWFLRSPGRYVEVPVKGRLEGLRYFTGEKLSEIVLYPVYEKKTDSGPYPFILNRFREKLASSRLLVTIGYSFRDKNIRSLIIEQMRANPRLWMLLASPHADFHREELCNSAPELAKRMVSFREDVETSITRRRLRETVRLLDSARSSEDIARDNQAMQSTVTDLQWLQCLQPYLHLRHYTKVKEIGREILLDVNLTKSPNFMVERFYAPLLLRFGLEDLSEGNSQDSRKWLEYFAALCPVADDNLIIRYVNGLPNQSERDQLETDFRSLEGSKREAWVRAVGIPDMGQFLGEINTMTRWFSHRIHGQHFPDMLTLLEALVSTSNFLNPEFKPGEHILTQRDRLLPKLKETIKENAGGFYAIASRMLLLCK